MLTIFEFAEFIVLILFVMKIIMLISWWILHFVKSQKLTPKKKKKIRLFVLSIYAIFSFITLFIVGYGRYLHHYKFVDSLTKGNIISYILMVVFVVLNLVYCLFPKLVWLIIATVSFFLFALIKTNQGATVSFMLDVGVVNNDSHKLVFPLAICTTIDKVCIQKTEKCRMYRFLFWNCLNPKNYSLIESTPKIQNIDDKVHPPTRADICACGKVSKVIGFGGDKNNVRYWNPDNFLLHFVHCNALWCKGLHAILCCNLNVKDDEDIVKLKNYLAKYLTSQGVKETITLSSDKFKKISG